MSCSCKNQPQDAVRSGRFRGANQRAHVVGCEAVETVENKGFQPSLGSTAKTVGQIDGRRARFRRQRHAAKLLGDAGRVGLCRWSVVSKSAGVSLVTSHYGDDPTRHAHFEGLQTCGSVWLCPCCSARISETRRGELNSLLSWARREGHVVQMITLTARHGREDDLGELLDGMKKAKKAWAQHRTYRALKPLLVGSVTATEVTGGGAHGWHPHYHVMVITRSPVDLEALREPWLASLRGAGLEGGGAAFDVQDANEAGAYVAKWGAAEELALSGEKKGRAGRTPAQLLAASCDDGDDRAGQLWREYAKAFTGRRQLVWSRGLKAMAGIDQVEDEEAARDEAQAEQVEDGRAKIAHADWRRVASRSADRRAELLEIAEDEGAAAAAAAAADFEIEPEDAETAGMPEPASDRERARLIGDFLEEIEAAEGRAYERPAHERKEHDDERTQGRTRRGAGASSPSHPSASCEWIYSDHQEGAHGSACEAVGDLRGAGCAQPQRPHQGHERHAGIWLAGSSAAFSCAAEGGSEG